MYRNQTLNERQRESLSTCLPSCRNIVYPSLGAAEEIAEYLQKLKHLVTWNPAMPSSEKDHLTFLLDGFITTGLALGRYAKKYRHSSTEAQPEGFVPFTLKQPSDFEFPEFGTERIEDLLKEVGDVKWMLDAIDFFVHNPAGTDPSDPEAEMTAQTTADQNFQKLAERRVNNTIDGKGDNRRSSID